MSSPLDPKHSAKVRQGTRLYCQANIGGYEFFRARSSFLGAEYEPAPLEFLISTQGKQHDCGEIIAQQRERDFISGR